MTETTTIARISINDQDMTRSFDIATQISIYRNVLTKNGVSAAMADQMCFRLNEKILAERFPSQPQVLIHREG